MKRETKTTIRYGVVILALLGVSFQSLAADVMTSVQQVLSNPSAFHRHDVVLKGKLKLVGQMEGKNVAGAAICGPIFELDDDTGEIRVIYLIRCDEQEVSRVSAMAGGRAIVYATIDSITVTINADGSESRTRAMATKIQRDDK
ncbi:MAG: hypothetical protein L0H94_13405 [Nitrospira sp.]|nr:hypothetical protein [Nitrospira sp.]